MNLNKENNKKIKLLPEMLNLLGCNKTNFISLIKLMNYKSFEINNETYFKYIGKKFNISKKISKIRDNPFNVLTRLNIK